MGKGKDGREMRREEGVAGGQVVKRGMERKGGERGGRAGRERGREGKAGNLAPTVISKSRRL